MRALAAVYMVARHDLHKAAVVVAWRCHRPAFESIFANFESVELRRLAPPRNSATTDFKRPLCWATVDRLVAELPSEMDAFPSQLSAPSHWILKSVSPTSAVAVNAEAR